MKKDNQQIVFSGMRPTGSPHLGHLAGALRNWLKLQDLYSCYFCIVTWHAFSSEYQNSQNIKKFTLDYAINWLSIGLDPKKSTIFIQSEVKEHAELFLLLSMIIPLPWLQRVPTFKEMQKTIKDRDLNTYGFLGYPVLQTADIILYKAGLIPVGEDQAYHLELAREITRRFNRYYGEIFPEPKMLLTDVPKLAGTDGRKMSNSLGNIIYMNDSPDTIRKKISPMVTDVRRKRRTDPGDPNDCPAFTLHKAFLSKEKQKELIQGCKTAAIGCLDCKKVVIEALNEELTPFRERYIEYSNHKDTVWDILKEGNKKAKETAQKTMEEVRKVIGI